MSLEGQNKPILFIGILIFYLLNSIVYAQDNLTKSWNAELSSISGFSSNKTVPFWLRSNQYGAIPSEGISTALEGKFHKAYTNDSIIWDLDWAVGSELRGNLARRSNIQIMASFAKLKYGAFELTVGRTREASGLVDSTLSSGSFSLSGNALGVPKIELGIPEYFPIPFTKKLISIKGNLSHGWMGKEPIRFGRNAGKSFPTYFHHLSFYGKLGKAHWRWNLQGAVNHDVLWGSERSIYDDSFDLNFFQAFRYVLTGENYGKLTMSKVGNHLGSLDLSFQYKFKDFSLRAYRQFFYDKGALGYLENISDGLSGLVYEDKQGNKVLLEYFNSTNQAARLGAKKTPSGPEFYYNHGVYANGFSYNGLGLGTPLIIPAKDAREGQVNDPQNYFISNKVKALHLGGVWDFNWANLLTKITYAKHYGEYRTNGPDKQWHGGQWDYFLFEYGVFQPVDQFSAFLSLDKSVKNGYRYTITVAGDYGKMLNNSAAIYMGITKVW